MAAERKISDEELARLRNLSEDGWSHADLAEAFGVTPQHVGRLLRGEQRPVIAGLDPEALSSGVAGAVEAFLADVVLNAGDEVLAATARALGAKLDACGASDSASAAQAVPRLSSELVDVLERLRLSVPREPDELDLIRLRRRQRRQAIAAGSNGNGGA